MDEPPTERPLDCGEKVAAGLSSLGHRDYAAILLQDLDYDAQLRAISDLLRCHRQAASELREEIGELDADARRSSGLRSQLAVDEWVERMHHSVYQDAAHSMAAVGMIAPLVESTFYQVFSSLRMRSEFLPSEHERWQHTGNETWDCHYVWRSGKWSRDLVAGILDLAAAVGLLPYLPSDLGLKLEALFRYRNKMFHHGFEWPLDERRRFDDQKNGWPDYWFRTATSGGDPWIFYMAYGFIDEWLKTMEQIVESIGAFARTIADGKAA